MRTEPATESRQFDYNPKWSMLILLAAMFGGAAAFFAYKANSNEFGLVINGIVHLSKNGANIFYWSLSGFSVLIVIAAVVMAAFRLIHHQRIVVEVDALVVPKGRWSFEKMRIKFDEIVDIRLITIPDQMLYLYRNSGNKYVIGAALLGGNKQFTEFCEILFARLKRAQSIDT